MSLEALCEAVETGDRERTRALAQKLMEEGADPFQTISSLTELMAQVGERFSRLEIFLPEMMKSGEAMAAAVEIFGPKLKEGEGGRSKGKIVLGTVKGDLHEIGKNVVKLMLEANGFEVKDLGYDVDSMHFIKEADSMGADVIAASSLMTTTMPHQKEIIDLLRDRGMRDRYKVVIGGAPTTQQWADEIGADLYCYDAGSASKLIAELLEG
ncbi:MAG: corrinoid protein [Deltaproteobacteria bacterium]|nr:corrinoid protein [Deltaproteobacteria bacterium]MBW2123817.1 corrinoid protein [Deltaproteobacteria bacterium]